MIFWTITSRGETPQAHNKLGIHGGKTLARPAPTAEPGRPGSLRLEGERVPNRIQMETGHDLRPHANQLLDSQWRRPAAELLLFWTDCSFNVGDEACGDKVGTHGPTCCLFGNKRDAVGP